MFNLTHTFEPLWLQPYITVTGWEVEPSVFSRNEIFMVWNHTWSFTRSRWHKAVVKHVRRILHPFCPQVSISNKHRSSSESRQQVGVKTGWVFPSLLEWPCRLDCYINRKVSVRVDIGNQFLKTEESSSLWMLQISKRLISLSRITVYIWISSDWRCWSGGRYQNVFFFLSPCSVWQLEVIDRCCCSLTTWNSDGSIYRRV